ncbi:hypothetical protein G9A89_019246 [Geosiphon pyriformis]|nr:hypothetical protein G9A89_019246 [Geosiphon pyriformis]
MTACSTPDKDPRKPTHYYCNRCNKEKYGYPERHGKWNKKPCLACRKPLPRECDWNNIPGRGGMCDTTCQYMILICDWIRGGTPFEAVFNRALKRLQHYPHDKNELYNTAQAKSAKVANKVASYNMFDPVDKFQDYYQQLCPTRQEDLERKMEIENQQSQNQSINQQDSPNGPESKKFVVYTDLEQITDIRYFNNGHLGIISERVHLTNARFDLYYSEDQSTTLPFRSITKIDLKIVVKIPPGIMIQIASRSSLMKKRNKNLMVLLQNNSKKPYTIESKEKIAQAIFLPLVKIGKFVPVENREELSQTTRRTFGFGSTEKGIEANFAKTIEEKGKIKIPIANTTEEPVYIPENTIIGYLGMELENASTPQEILNFPEIALYCELTSINWQQPLECYQFMPEKLAKLNIRTMDPDQQQQLKALILKYSDIFSRNGEFGRTNLVQHQISTGNTRPEKQCAYCVPPMEHNFIREEF